MSPILWHTKPPEARSAETEVRQQRPLHRVLPTTWSFSTVAVIAFLAFAANTAASPLYRVYHAEFHFSPAMLTLLFTVYIVVLLFTLLFLGSLSDHVGRRPVILSGLVAGAVASGLFLLAHGVTTLFAGRALQGVAVGFIGGAANAALLDLRPGSRAAPVVSSVALSGGQALGAIGASALAQYGPAPTRLVWWLLLGAFVLGGLAVAVMPEPGSRRPGAVSSLRPQLSLPRSARGAFVVALPCLIAVWALAGFYLSLGPSLAVLLFHSDNLMWGGVLISLFTGLGAAASTAVVKGEPAVVMLGGCLTLIAGVIVTFTSIDTSAPAILFIGAAIAGLGFGPAFLGAYRATIAVAPSGGRAGLITAVYVVSYLATGVPAVVGGIATSRYGLHTTALAYSLLVGAFAGVAVILLIARTVVTVRTTPDLAYPDPPPGPGTAPPCPPGMNTAEATSTRRPRFTGAEYKPCHSSADPIYDVGLRASRRTQPNA